MFLPISASRPAPLVGDIAAINTDAAVIVTKSLSTAGLASYSLTVQCNQITSKSVVLASLQLGTNAQGTPAIGPITPSDNGTVVIVVYNLHATLALNGTLIISLAILN